MYPWLAKTLSLSLCDGGLVGDNKEPVLNLLLGWLDPGDDEGVAVCFQPQQSDEMF